MLYLRQKEGAVLGGSCLEIRYDIRHCQYRGLGLGLGQP